MKIIERISNYIESQGFSVRSFEQKIGTSNGTIANAINKGTEIQAKWLSKIIENYTDMNPIWLLTGTGSMLKEKKKEVENSSNTDIMSIKLEYLEKIEALRTEIDSLRKELDRLRANSTTTHRKPELIFDPRKQP